MKKGMIDQRSRWAGLIILILVMALFTVSIIDNVLADATGASSIVNHSHSTKNSTYPQSRNDSRGSIHTVTLSSQQQNQKWKAYVGNVTTVFTLDDAADYTIYQWQVDSFTGQVYITRNDSISWDIVGCAGEYNKTFEDNAIDHNSVKSDSVNRTFTAFGHKSFTIGSRSIPANSCYSIATWVNDTEQSVSSTALFQEVLLWDNSTSSMIYTTFTVDDYSGYRNDTPATTYDFQAIVPDDGDVTDPPRRYYFYLELQT